MCNLYSVTTNQAALRALVNAFRDDLGNLPPLPGIYPDYFAPVVRGMVTERTLSLARWGLPSLVGIDDGKPNRGNTNIRRPWLDDWKGYLVPENRCLVPFNRFSEPTKLDSGESGNAWFALDESEPLLFFAGLRTSWRGMRRKDEGVTDHEVFGFLTTQPNDVVGAIHEKAMPVVLTTPEEWEAWLGAPWSEARDLQRPLPNGVLQIVHRTALKYLPGVEGIPSGDPLRPTPKPKPEEPEQPSLF